MKPSGAERRRLLLEALDRLVGVPILVVGDLILDRYVWGKVERISPEAPVPVVEVKRTEDRLGGAGNVARNLAGLGVKVNLAGFVGDDEEGRAIVALADGAGMGKDAIMFDRSRPTILKTRVIAQAQQVVRIDREQRTPHAAVLRDAFIGAMESQLQTARGVIVSDYAKGVVSDRLMERCAALIEQGVLGAPNRPLVVDPHPTNSALYKRMTVAKPNRAEAEQASGIKIGSRADAEQAAKLLLDRWGADLILLSLSEDGLLIVGKDMPPGGAHLPTEAREVFDVSGAGDTVTAVFTAALAAGVAPIVAGDLANVAAGIVIGEIGTAAISTDQLREEISSW